MSQAELGMIPGEAANIIARAARIDRLDLAAISAGIATTGHSLVPLLRDLERVTGGYASQFIHLGATTHDIQDTAQSLEIRDVLSLVERDLLALLDQLDRMAHANRNCGFRRARPRHRAYSAIGVRERARTGAVNAGSRRRARVVRLGVAWTLRSAAAGVRNAKVVNRSDVCFTSRRVVLSHQKWRPRRRRAVSSCRD